LIVSFNSNAGCQVGQISGFFIWVERNRYALFPFLIIFGLLICFAGKQYLKYLIFFAGVVEATILIIIIVYNTFAYKSNEVWVGWVVLLCSLLIGICVGFLLMKYEKVGGFFLVAWGGFNTGLLFYNAFLYKINSDWALWGFSIGIGLLYAILMIFFFDDILIHATAMIGSFTFVYGVGTVAGGYTSPFLIVDLIKYGQIDNVDPLFYAYFGGNLVLYGLGCLWQYRQLKINNKLQKQLKGSTVSTVRASLAQKGRNSTRGSILVEDSNPRASLSKPLNYSEASEKLTTK
jgi:Domain of unknown function (DUF4203)